MPIPPAPARVKKCSYYPREDMFLWKVAGIQISLWACHGLLQEMGRYVIPRHSPETCAGLLQEQKHATDIWIQHLPSSTRSDKVCWRKQSTNIGNAAIWMTQN